MMVYWRFKRNVPGPWVFGFMTQIHSGLVRMGRWNGDYDGGQVVSEVEVEWKPYR